MKNLYFLIALIILILSCKNSPNEIVNLDKERITVKQTIENTIGWAIDKDTSLLYSIVANDENYLEVHPNNSVVKGITQFRGAESFWLDARFKHVSFETWDMQINFSEDGKVAWYYCMLNDLNDWDGRAVNWENTRWTGVLEKRNGNWRMVQMHFSSSTNQ